MQKLICSLIASSKVLYLHPSYKARKARRYFSTHDLHAEIGVNELSHTFHRCASLRIDKLLKLKLTLKLICDLQSVGQSVLVSGAHLENSPSKTEKITNCISHLRMARRGRNM
jgi:hypothetical protein